MFSKSLLRSFGKKAPNRLVSFAVDDVAQAVEPICTETLVGSLSRRLDRKVLLVPESNRPVITSAFIDSLSEEQRARFSQDLGSTCHPLIDAVHTAFSEHRPLLLSPDSIWLVIAQGFSHHITQNAEALRPRLVRHQGVRELVEKISDLKMSSFEHAISGLSSQIREATDPVLHETLVCDFSTTTPATRIASEMVLLDSFSKYFKYSMECICGIPRITLAGSLEDWQRIRARIEVIETYDLGWWVARLRPILDEFVRTAEGHPAREFWQAIYKPKQAYGDTVATGWITDLFPYLGDAPRRARNPVFKNDRQNWALPVEQGLETKGFFFGPGVHEGVSNRSFPSGLCRLPVQLQSPNRPPTHVDLIAGFFAVAQNPSDLALSPVLSWCVTGRASDPPTN